MGLIQNQIPRANEDEQAKEDVERRARELARRVMSTPPQPNRWPKKDTSPKKDRERASKPRKRGQAGEAS